MAAIAEHAGVDRSTVYRRFANREALLAAVHQAKIDSAERVMDEARLQEAPVAVALHRYVEGIVEVSRRWPVDLERFNADPAAAERTARLLGRLDAFIERAIREGLLDADPLWAREVLRAITHVAAHGTPDMPPGRAADLVTKTLLAGLG